MTQETARLHGTGPSIWMFDDVCILPTYPDMLGCLVSQRNAIDLFDYLFDPGVERLYELWWTMVGSSWINIFPAIILSPDLQCIGLLTWGEVDKETDLVDAGSQTTRVFGSPRFLGLLGSLARIVILKQKLISLLLIKTVCRTGCFFQSVSAPSSAWLFEESRFVWRDWITRASFRCDSIPTGLVSVGRSFIITISKYKPYSVIHDAYL